MIAFLPTLYTTKPQNCSMNNHIKYTQTDQNFHLMVFTCFSIEENRLNRKYSHNFEIKTVQLVSLNLY